MIRLTVSEDSVGTRIDAFIAEATEMSRSGAAKLIHYNLDSKPWHKDGIEFSDIFWQYSDRSAFACEIREIRKKYRDQATSAAQTTALIDLAEAQGESTTENCVIRKTIERICG